MVHGNEKKIKAIEQQQQQIVYVRMSKFFNEIAYLMKSPCAISSHRPFNCTKFILGNLNGKLHRFWCGKSQNVLSQSLLSNDLTAKWH